MIKHDRTHMWFRCVPEGLYVGSVEAVGCLVASVLSDGTKVIFPEPRDTHERAFITRIKLVPAFLLTM